MSRKKISSSVKERARVLYQSGVSYAKVADRLGLNAATVKSWVGREGWGIDCVNK